MYSLLRLPQTVANNGRNKRRQQRLIQNPVRHLKWNVLQKQSMVHSFQLFSQNIRSLMFGSILSMPLSSMHSALTRKTNYFGSILSMPLSSMHFALTRKTNYFRMLIFGTCGANICMGIFL